MKVTFALLPASLLLHWLTNNLLSITSQRDINCRIEVALKQARVSCDGTNGF